MLLLLFALAALAQASAIYDVREALQHKVASQILCTAQPRAGSARAFYVSEAGYGWFNLDDFRASRTNAVLSFRSWSTLAEGSLSPTRACTASEPAELSVWLKAAQNTFVLVCINMYTQRPVFVSSPLALNYGIDVETLLATAVHAQRASIFVTTGRVVGAPASHSALLLEYSIAQDQLLNVYPIGQGLALNASSLLDVSGGVGSSLAILPSGALFVMLTNFSVQARDSTAFLKPPLLVIYEANSVARTMVKTVSGELTDNNVVTQQLCLNARYGGVSFAYIERQQTTTAILVEGFDVINAAGHVTGGGLTGFAHTNDDISVGGCVWDLSESSIFRTLYTNGNDAAGYARLSIPSEVTSPQTTFFTLTSELLSGTTTFSAPHPLRRLEVVVASLPPFHNGIAHPERWRALTRASAGRRVERARERALRIIMGEGVDSIERAPYACHLLTPFGDICGCFILDEWNVGTAAHCLPQGAVTLNTTLVAPYFVIVGTTSLGNQAGDGLVVTSRRSATHPSWAGVAALDGFAMSPLRQDTAVLRLDSALVFSSKIRAISVASTSALSQPGQQLSMFGWGVTETGTVASQLKTLNVTVTSGGSRGRSPLYRKFHVESSVPGQEACYGDSGSGLVAYDGVNSALLVGIMSYSASGTCDQKSSYAADVSSAYEWLQRRNELEFTTTLPGGSFAAIASIRNGRMLSYRRAPLHDETIVYSDNETLLLCSLNVAYARGCVPCRA